MLPMQTPQPAAIFDWPVAKAWLNHIAESNVISNAILAVIHPCLHSAGQKTLKQLQLCPDVKRQDVLSQWNSVFSGVSVIYNGTVPAHRDSQSRHHWYDLLVTLGRYRNCKLELPGVGITMDYGPGTVVGISGMMLEHQVRHFEGERVSYAHFMRDRVHEWAQVDAGGWMNTNYYE